MSRISVRGFAVASATAVTAVGSVVGVASGSVAQPNDAESTASDATLLADIPAGQQAQVQTATVAQQANYQAIAADEGAKKEAEAAARKAAAETAVAKKEAAEKAAKERAEAKAKASRSASDFPVQSSYTVAQIQAMAAQMVPSGQFQCFSNIVDHESSWNYHAVNASSGAYGLFQALPAGKYASAGADWQTNPATQIKWGLNYMDSRYGSPCEAWSFWQANHWY
ncbi:transglycosylase SLT domain-containing protein [Streptomyces sp. NBC_00582]|uniref:aggregation-promoting factor C-terminal-like domain-containing protein n=1 Tax=Streptomyces sp. NBC_00582 TaxID=2975783 RepID=UPI00106347C1|nr:transglycosylase SLT domain-containing protein [Streptomyces sp. NBC_00582]WUB62197.1 transglycosylase SLT domain-containing protein [Streptomyces sp. NBC_00582]